MIKTKWYLCQYGLLNDDTLKQSDTCVPGQWIYWMMIFWLKQSDTCVNGGLLNDDTLIKTKGYLEIKTKWYLCQWWFIE